MGTSRRTKVLLADQDEAALNLLERHFQRVDIETLRAEHPGQVWAQLQQGGRIGMVVMDVHWSKANGMQLLAGIRTFDATLPIVVVTAHGSIERAVQAVKLGAVDFMTKPVDLERLETLVRATLGGDERAAPVRAELLTSGPVELRADEILGSSWLVQQLRGVIADVAATDAKILIMGESGTGKELAARAIHRLSRRSGQPFVPVNMAALPATLAESVLFGHEKGSFTGAFESQKGWCEVADSGTLFLDEIGEMDMMLQAKLLRFLQDNSFQRVGSSRVITTDVRIVAATNGEPDSLIRDGKLRADLYHRLNVVPIFLPPLRERADDIPELTQAFVNRYATQYQKQVTRFTDRAIRSLQAYDWPGNIRELENLVHRLVVLTQDTEIDEEQLPANILTWHANGVGLSEREVEDGVTATFRPMDQMEKKAIMDALTRADGNAVSAAQMLGMGQATMYRKIKRYGIPLKKLRRSTESWN